MSIDLPSLHDYNVSAEYGFLPSDWPAAASLLPHYERWEDLCSNLPHLLESRRLRFAVRELPVLYPDHLETEAQLRKAYSLLSFLAHAYIWGGDQAEEVWI